MSNKDLEKLADLIVDRLIKKQEEIDAEFFEKHSELHMLVEDDNIPNLNQDLLDATKAYSEEGALEHEISKLARAIKDAIRREDYIAAGQMSKKIAELENKLEGQ
jgi:hypothetical protein|tara:strand:- start:596 stop:910 length:315 start_codon:yes stop_codon:yes gene_type:complete